MWKFKIVDINKLRADDVCYANTKYIKDEGIIRLLKDNGLWKEYGNVYCYIYDVQDFLSTDLDGEGHLVRIFDVVLSNRFDEWILSKDYIEKDDAFAEGTMVTRMFCSEMEKLCFHKIIGETGV